MMRLRITMIYFTRVCGKPKTPSYCFQHIVMRDIICGTRNRLSQGCANKIWIHKQYFEDQLMEQIVEVVLKDGPLEAYLQRCQQEYQKQQEEANQQLVGIRKQIEVTEYRLENLLNALANDLLPPDAIRDKYDRRNRLSELKKRQDTQPIELDRFRQLLKEELEQEESRKSALHALIERITAYPDRKMEVKFRIGERVEPVKIVTPFLKLIFCAGKLSDVMYVPPWLMSKWVAGNVDFAQRPVVISISKQGRCHHADFVLDGPLQMTLQVIDQIVTNCN